MQKADDYPFEEHFKSLAKRLLYRAATEKSPAQRAELERLAECYETLAQQKSITECFDGKLLRRLRLLP